MLWLDLAFWVSLLSSTLRLSTPLTFAALGGFFSERSGVVNIALEGLMLIGAFAAAWGNLYFQSSVAGVLCGILAAMLVASLHAVACVKFKADQIVSGMAINIFAFGLAPMLSKALFGTRGSSPQILSEIHMQTWNIPLLEKIPFFGDVLSHHIPLVYLAIVFVFMTHLWSKKSALGLHHRAVGDHPEAADSLGIKVNRFRIVSVLCSGVLCGLAGAFLSIGHGSGFARNMTSGRGYIALTAMIFGKWKPIPTFFACLLFGFTDALQIRMQGTPLPGLGEIPPQFVQLLPYVVTMVVLAGFIGSSQAPKALGIPYIKE
ncbi:MAG: ABC transporter permease [Bdellovibrionales bacterium]|nr:ABC transporter permease [Bdellovibrionales bacterium]